MNDQFKVSIIVAVYNVEKYIHRCVNSLLCQTHHNIEVLLVDDGSIDGSAAICDEYAAKDSRVKAIHQKNGGVSSARQTGLEAASGEFVIHADPDDYVDADMIESLLTEVLTTDADIVTCDFYMNEQVMKQHYKGSADLLKKLISVETICVCWNSMVRRDFIVKHHVAFTPSWLCMSEDFLFICRLLVAGAKAVHLQRPFYHYWVSNAGSLTNKRSEKKLRSLMEAIDELGKIVKSSDYDEFYTRKKYVVLYAYHGKMFKKAKMLYPEIRNRIELENIKEAARIYCQFPALKYYLNRTYFYCKRIFKIF